MGTLSEAPVRQDLLTGNKLSSGWSIWFTQVYARLASAWSVLTLSAEPTNVDGEGYIFFATTSGTLNGVAYERGDVVFTGEVDGTAKTKLLVDWSTL